ncbi:protein disulfide isomerase [Tricholoma matsutake]|nr:protein disulfide isomerase [Tricholoma matsutake 945]
MHLLSVFRQLPVSLFLSVLLISASPVDLRDDGVPQLTPDTFPTSGLSFIEFYSPTCPHCTNFAPTWKALFEEAKTSMPSVLVAQVNCNMYGDLCDENHISGYPTMIIYYHNGQSTTYSGDRTLPDLVSFVQSYASSSSTVPEEPRAIANPVGQVLELSSESFAAIRSKGPMFVKFFAPWCGHCKKLAPAWKELARHMQNKLTIAEVNCDELGTLCNSHNIQGYPTLLYFPAEGQSIEYNGGRKLDQLKFFAENATAAGVKGIRPEQLDTLVAEHDVLYLLLHSASDTKILDKVQKAASPLLGSPPIFSSSAPALLTRFFTQETSTWALVALKDHDSNTPSSILYEHTSTDEKLKFWLLSHRLSTTTELTQDTFQKVMNAPQAPLVVIAAVTEGHKTKVEEHFRHLAKKWRIRTSGTGMVHGREVIFTWMDMDKWGDWMKSMYGIRMAYDGSGTLDDVPVIISDHRRLIYYDQDSSDSRIRLTSPASLFSAVEAAAGGSLNYKHSENFVERMARYLNTKMTSFADYVVTYPLRSMFFLVVVLGLVGFGIKRLIADDLPPEEGYRASKTHRLD